MSTTDIVKMNAFICVLNLKDNGHLGTDILFGPDYYELFRFAREFDATKLADKTPGLHS
jgi:hypothetical protein